MQPFTKRLVELLPNQFHSKAVEVDNYLRVRGAPKGTVYALGDAATVSPASISFRYVDRCSSCRSTPTSWAT